MKHRIMLRSDVRAHLADYARELSCSTAQLQEAFDWMLAHEIAFEDSGRFWISSIDIEKSIEAELPRRFYARLKTEIPSKLVPQYGKNWITVKDRFLRVWEQIYNILINKIPSHNLRIWWLRLGGAKIGKGSSIWRNTEVLGVENLVMGDDSVIAWHCQVDARAGLVIGDHVAIASHVLIIAGSHDLTAPEFWSISAPIYIDDYAWIASRAIIGHGSHIGEGAVVTANTVLAKEVAPYKIVGGSGAKIMGERPRGLNYKVGGKGLFTFLH